MGKAHRALGEFAKRNRFEEFIGCDLPLVGLDEPKDECF